MLQSFHSSDVHDDGAGPKNPLRDYLEADTETGVLNPIVIEHTGEASGPAQHMIGRTDVESSPGSEAWLPAGSTGNSRSADCTGGYFLVGAGGSADFGSPEGTISLWTKWDGTAPNGRLWGQDFDFETRWSSGRLVLDWGSDTTFQCSKDDWEPDHWYFIAISWDEDSDTIEIFWGDEETEPTEDASTGSWTGSVVGFHSENDIMNSAARTDQVDGHVDDFRYYDRQRGRNDLTSDYRESITGAEPGLIHYYEFEDDLSDSAGSAYLYSSGSYSFSRDVAAAENGWRAEQIEVSVTDLKRLLVLNSTFENGNPGVNVDWSGDGQYYASGWLARREYVEWRGWQRAAYVNTDPKYVILENEGYAVATPDGYRHYNGTRVYWYQDVANSELTDEFAFSLDFYYQRGPIGTNYSNIFKFKFEILDGPSLLWNWSIDPVNITQRGVWYNVGPMAVNIPGAPASFQVRVSLEVHLNSSYIQIPITDPDLDGDNANGQFVTFLVDDVSFTAAEAPSYESVNLSVSSNETGPVQIVEESGTGYALLNHSFWYHASIPITFQANTSVSFDYSTKVSRMSGLYNSSFTTSLSDLGVAYQVGLDQSSKLSLFTYIRSYPEAENLGFIVHHPSDWENATIKDPFGTDVTSQSIVGFDSVEIPMGAVDSVGWWTIEMNGSNYAKNIATQVYSLSSWEEDSVFLSGDRMRCKVNVGTQAEIPSSVLNLEVTWYSPSDIVWASEVDSNMTGSVIVSDGRTLGPYNATPGDWMISAFWTNGTEVAFGSTAFEVRHQLTVFSYTPHVEAELDENFTAAVYLHDQDNGNPILNGANVVGNWSGMEIYFSPNLAKGWYEADFDTSLTGAGSFVIVVNATMPYHNESNCTMTVDVLTLTVMTVLGNQFVEISPGGSYEAKFRFMFLDGSGIDDANVSVFSWTGPPVGLQYNDTEPVPGELGNYSIQFTGDFGGVYVITVTGAKQNHATAATSLYLVVGPVSTELDVVGGGLPEVLYYNQTYTFSLLYRTLESVGVEDATVNVTYNPVSIVDWLDPGQGYYNISIRVPDVGSYAVYLRFYKQGFAYADISFGFDVAEIPTTVTGSGLMDFYYESRTYEFEVFYNSTLENGIVGAQITPSTAVRDFFRFTESGEGWYRFTLAPMSGNWNATIWLEKEGYQEGTFSFDMGVDKIPIRLAPEFPLNQTYTKLEGTRLSLQLVPIANDTGSMIPDAIVTCVLSDTNGQFQESKKFDYAIGVYSMNITVPGPGLYLLRITIERDHHETWTDDIVLSSEANPEKLVFTTFAAGLLGALALGMVVAAAIVGRRYYTRVTARRTLELLTLKGRLEDAKNLISLLVIHRSTGLPVYSRVFKGGFEESMLSSFIAAISQFRAEFSGDEPIWNAIPISEVVTAVQTEVLICAIVTVEQSSETQKGQLEAFGRDVGGLFDHEDEAIRQMFHTPELSEEFSQTFDPIFESYFDGALLTRYVGVRKDLPDHLTPVADAFHSLSIDYGVTPEAMIKAVIFLGYSERRAYEMVLEAIDGRFMIAGERRLPAPIESP